MASLDDVSIIFHCFGLGYAVTKKEIKKVLKRA